MTDREQFEAWASDNNEWPQCIERSGDSYKLMQTKLKWEAWQAARAQLAQTMPVLSDAEIKAAATKAIHAGYLSWIGFEQDADGRYTIPSLSLSNYQFARAIEQVVRAKLNLKDQNET